MGRAWSLDLRRRAVDAIHNGEGTLQEIADRFCIGRTTLCDLLRRERLTNSIAPASIRGRPPRRVDDSGRELLHQVITDQPDGTLAELTAAYNAVAVRTISATTVGKELRAMNL